MGKRRFCRRAGVPELGVLLVIASTFLCLAQLRASTIFMAHSKDDLLLIPKKPIAAKMKPAPVQEATIADSGAAPAASQRSTSLVVPIVMEGTGELGNHLYKLVYGKTVELMARDKYNIDTSLIMRDHRFHKNPIPSKTFTNSREVLMGCFPNVRKYVDYDYQPHTKSVAELKARIISQMNWLGSELAGKLFMNSGTAFEYIDEGLSHLKKIIDDMEVNKGDTTKMCSQTIRLADGANQVVEYTCLPPAIQDINATFTLPFVFLKDLGTSSHLDRNYENMRDFLYFDESGTVGQEKHTCCGITPDPKEHVFHFRNFRHEVHPSFMKKTAGFHELSPEKTANELFKDLKPGEQVSILTRYSVEKSPRTQEYVDALEQRGLNVRVVSGQQPYQDFCYMKRTRKLLVGSAFSTFSTFAGFLSNDRSLEVFRYLVEVPKWPKEENITWTNPELRERMQFGLFKP